MPTMHLSSDDADQRPKKGSLRFPEKPVRDDRGRHAERAPLPDPLDHTVERTLETVESMSRRIRDLARELNCLGYFDDDDDGPRAA